MFKLNYKILPLVLLGIVVLAAICESAAVASKTKARSKILIKKKKIVVLSTTPPTTTTTEQEIPEETSATIRPDSFEDSNDSRESTPEEKSSEGTTSSSSRQNGGSATTNPAAAGYDSGGRTGHTRSPPKTHRSLNSCDECIAEDCETPPETSCPLGLTMDHCNCCFICASVEGNRCFNATLDIPYNPNLGVCGPGLTCQLRNDLEPYEQKEALCECGSKTTICGSDNRTYQSECKLIEAAHLNPNITVKHWHPCYSAPTIPARVENVTVGTGDDVSLSCEVRAFPPPVIHWEFLPEDSPARQVLPGDDSSVVVTIRGGPEQIMTTSWIQIVSATPSRQGVYFCLARNAEGMTQSSARVSVYKNI